MRRSAKKELALFFEFVKRKNVLHNKIPILVFLSLTFLLALAIRIHNLDVPGIAIDREYRSALIARAYYFDGTDSIAEWRHEVISASKKRAGVLEPPITEILASIIYRFADDEQLWMARLLTSIFWLIGGIFLFIIAARIESYEAGLVSTAYYLLVPVGVLYSRTFIPDSLMIMAFLFSLFLIVQHHDQPTERRLIQAASISGLSILIKPLIIFALLGAYTALAITRKANNSIGKELLIFGTVCLFPALTYYGYGIISGTALGNQFHGTFLPQLLL